MQPVCQSLRYELQVPEFVLNIYLTAAYEVVLMIILTLQLRKGRPGEEVKDLAQSRTAHKWERQGAASDGVTFKASALPSLHYCTVLYLVHCVRFWAIETNQTPVKEFTGV